VNEGSGVFDALDRYVRVLLQRGRVQLDVDEDEYEYEYVRMRRLAVAILESVDRALGLSLFEPADESQTHPAAGSYWSDRNEHDPGIVLVELLAYAADALASYADRVAAEERLRTRRHAVAAVAALVALAWCCRRRR
jgi:hypothetical protein